MIIVYQNVTNGFELHNTVFDSKSAIHETHFAHGYLIHEFYAILHIFPDI